MNDKTFAKELFTDLEKSVIEGNVKSLKKIYNSIGIGDQVTNLVILACEHNKVKILKYLLSSGYISKTAILPDGEDETRHSAFYYAIRSGNIELLNTLITKWPDNYFAYHLGELDEILSRAYDDLKLKNVTLSHEIEIFVENQLINLRFFSDNSKQAQNIKTTHNNINKRIGLVLENITLLNAEYRNDEEVDERFLFIAKFIARNIYVLKRQLKSTYISLPWEELEFCLVSFISSYIKQQEINLYYQTTLNKGKILNYLEHFSKKLEDEQNNIKVIDITKLAELPNLNRTKVVAGIIINTPQFANLYHDYQQIRDIHSLMKINNYIELALSADPKERLGQLIITRVLQGIGEYIKNTLESPKLSNATNELLLLLLPTNTRKIIIDLRNSFSHAYSLSKRTQIEEIKNVNFFIGVQGDIQKIDTIITDILYKNKMNTIAMLLKKIINCENFREMNEIAKVIENVEIEEIFLKSSNIMKHEKMEELIKKLSNLITEPTNYEKELLSKINGIINIEKNKLKEVKTNYIIGLSLLKSVSIQIRSERNDHNTTRIIKYGVTKTLENITQNIELGNVKDISELTRTLFYCVRSRMQHNNFDEISRLLIEIFFIAEFEGDSVQWIEELRENLNEKLSFIPQQKQKGISAVKNYNTQLNLKLSELKSVLSRNDEVIENVSLYKKNKKLQSVVEMLVLDIISILDISKNSLEDNLLFLDDNSPLLTGKCLRNHLAHDNVLVEVLVSNPSISVVLNAKKLTAENISKSKTKIGKSLKVDLSKLKNKLDRGLVDINNQKNMFIAAEEGNLEDLTKYIKRGADINARNINLWTTLHFAAKGTSIELIKFLLNQKLCVNVKDINNQSPLHIAAANGRKSIVELLVKEINVDVDDVGSNGKTPLHIAAQRGHKDTVVVLLKNKASTSKKDHRGHSPLHYAVENNHKDVVEILLEKEVNVDINETMGGYTSLHIAAENGFLGLVNFLLKNKANVNAKNDKGGIPLHTAALNGHLEVVNALILNGSDVSARVLEGCTPLHYAVENGHEEIAHVLLKHGSNVNAVDKSFYNTPLHYAAKDGHKEIVKTLLKYKANVSVATIEGITPLHLAAQSGHSEIVAILLKHGVNIHAKNKNNATPLHCAAKASHKNVAELLIKNRAEIDAKANGNLTPLHVAAMEGNEDITDLLIKNKARVNARNIKGDTPIHAAATNGSRNIIDLLIKNKAEVNAKNYEGITPLHLAAANGHGDAIDLLIKSKAEVNSKANYGLTPLYSAIIGGHRDCVEILIKCKAEVNTKCNASTPLLVAVEGGHKEILEILIANGANVNIKCNNQTPLVSAIRTNRIEMVKVLTANGADVNADGGTPLSLAVIAGYRDIVAYLLKIKARVNDTYDEKTTLLHIAAKRGHKGIVKDLITKGADVNAKTVGNTTPLYFAAQEGHAEVVEVLIENGANISDANLEGAPIHIAAGKGHQNVIEILLNNEAEISIRDTKKRTPLELAVAHGHLGIVETLLQHTKVNINAKCSDDWTMLHIAAQYGHLEIISYLVEKGANINAKNASGSKPIHIAAREGYKNVVEFFLSKGLNINDSGAANQTLLHYSAIEGHLDVAQYLIEQEVDVNIKDANGQTPLHIAARFDCKNFAILLLKHGAIYNPVDYFNIKPLELAKNKDVINLLTSTTKLFVAVKQNKLLEVESYIKAGAIVNAKNTDSVTALHFAAWKGYDEAVSILLKNKANPNAICSKGFTPLHYAAKFSHLKAINILLSNGAVYNRVSDCGKTPSDLSVDKSITSLFKLISDSFKNVKINNPQVVNNLNKVNDIDAIKAIMNTRNSENQTLIVVAVHNNFSKVEQLKEISQGDISTEIHVASTLAEQGNYQKALSILKLAFGKRKEILGSDNPGTLDIQTYIAKILYKKGSYQEALNTLEEIFQKQKEMLGLNDKDTLSTRSTIALVLHRLGRDDEAFNIYQEVCQKQTQIFGPNHLNVLDTQFHMALVLDRLEKYEEALNINKTVLQKRKEILGANHPLVVCAENNIAMVLGNQGNYEEALKIYKEVYEKKKVLLGVNHADTLRTLHSIATVFFKQNKHNDAIKTYREVIDTQIINLGPNHPETLTTQHNFGNLLFSQGKWIGALQAFSECSEQMKAVFGPIDPRVLDIFKKMEAINMILKLSGSEASEVLHHLQEDIDITGKIGDSKSSETLLKLQRDINIAASEGDLQSVECLLRDGANANNNDIEGRTPLHFAISNRHIGVVEFLLKNGADVTRATNRGNTPLHTATSKDYKEIVEILLLHVNRHKLDEFINSKTTASGTTSLHIAAKNGSLDVTNSLLKRGAIYNIKNNEGKTPADLSKNQYIINLLKLIEELFNDAQNGDVEIINKLKGLKPDEILAATYARNSQSATLLQVAIVNNNRSIAAQILQAINMTPKMGCGKTSEAIQQLQKDIRIAVSKGDIPTVESLLKDGADVNGKDIDGRTLLHFAVSNGQLSVVNTLLMYGADVTQVTNKGNTPLHTAASKNYKDIIEIMLKLVCPNKLMQFINAKTTASGTTALHISAKNGSFDVTNILLKWGAIYNIRNNEGKIPADHSKEKNVINLLKLIEELFKDAEDGNVEVINKLKSVRPDEFLSVTNACNSQGVTLLQVVQSLKMVNKNKDIATFSK